MPRLYIGLRYTEPSSKGPPTTELPFPTSSMEGVLCYLPFKSRGCLILYMPPKIFELPEYVSCYVNSTYADARLARRQIVCFTGCSGVFLSTSQHARCLLPATLPYSRQQ